MNAYPHLLSPLKVGGHILRNRLTATPRKPLHYYSMFQAAWEALPTLTPLVNARCTSITESGVTYEDEAGREHALDAGNVVVAAGMKAKSAEALKYGEAGARLYLIGDCVKPGDVQVAMRSAFSTASTI